MITTIEQLQAYLAEMTRRADVIRRNGWPEATNVESVCARIWTEFTPHALTFWTIPGVLNHLSACLSPPDESEDDSDDE